MLGFKIQSDPESKTARASSSLGYLAGTNDEGLLKALNIIRRNQNSVNSNYKASQIAEFLNWIADGKKSEELPELAKTKLCDYRNRLAMASKDVGTALNNRSEENRIIAEIDAIFRDKKVNPVDCPVPSAPSASTNESKKPGPPSGPAAGPPSGPAPGPNPGPNLPAPMPPGPKPPAPPPPGPTPAPKPDPLVPTPPEPKPNPNVPNPLAPPAPNPANVPAKTCPASSNEDEYFLILNLFSEILDTLDEDLKEDFRIAFITFFKKFYKRPDVEKMDLTKVLADLLTILKEKGGETFHAELSQGIADENFRFIEIIIEKIKALFAGDTTLTTKVNGLIQQIVKVYLPPSIVERLEVFTKLREILTKIKEHPATAGTLLVEIFQILKIELRKKGPDIEKKLNDIIEKHTPASFCLDKLSFLRQLMAVTCGKSGLIDSLLEHINQMLATLPTTSDVSSPVSAAREKLEEIRSAVASKLEATDDPLNETSDLTRRLNELLAQLASLSPSNKSASSLVSTLEGNVRRRATLQKEIEEIQAALKHTDDVKVCVEEIVIQLKEEQKQLISLLSILKEGFDEDAQLLEYVKKAMDEVGGALETLSRGLPKNSGSALKTILTSCHRRYHEYSRFYKQENEAKMKIISELQRRLTESEVILKQKLEEAAATADKARAEQLSAAAAEHSAEVERMRIELSTAQKLVKQLEETHRVTDLQLTKLRTECGASSAKNSEMEARIAALNAIIIELRLKLEEAQKCEGEKPAPPGPPEPAPEPSPPLPPSPVKHYKFDLKAPTLAQRNNNVEAPKSPSSDVESAFTPLSGKPTPKPVPKIDLAAPTLTRRNNNVEAPKSPSSGIESAFTPLSGKSEPKPVPKIDLAAPTLTRRNNNVEAPKSPSSDVESAFTPLSGKSEPKPVPKIDLAAPTLTRRNINNAIPNKPTTNVSSTLTTIPPPKPKLKIRIPTNGPKPLPPSPSPGLNATPVNRKNLKTAVQGPNRVILMERLQKWLGANGTRDKTLPDTIESILSERNAPGIALPKMVKQRYSGTLKPHLKKIIEAFGLDTDIEVEPETQLEVKNLVNTVLNAALEKMPTKGGTRKKRKISNPTRKHRS